MLSWNPSKRHFRPWVCRAANIDGVCLGAERCEWRLTNKGFGWKSMMKLLCEEKRWSLPGPLCPLEQFAMYANRWRYLHFGLWRWGQCNDLSMFPRWFEPKHEYHLAGLDLSDFGWLGFWCQQRADVTRCLAWWATCNVVFHKRVHRLCSWRCSVGQRSLCWPQTNVFPVNGIHVLASRDVPTLKAWAVRRRRALGLQLFEIWSRRWNADFWKRVFWQTLGVQILALAINLIGVSIGGYFLEELCMADLTVGLF